MIKNLQGKVLLLIGLLLAGVSGAWADDYLLYSGALTEGDYLIVYDNGAMKNTVTSSRLDYSDVTPSNNVITTTDAAIVWHIAQSGDYWTLYNADAESYAAGTGAKNKAQMLEDGTDDKALWTVSGTETYEFVNKANEAANVNKNLRRNSTYGFACYATSTGGALSLYKKVESGPVDVTLSFAAVEPEVTLMKKDNNFEASYTQTVTANPAAYSGAVAYTVDEENSSIGNNTIAEVDNNGLVTIVASANEASTIVVKATGAAVNGKYNAPAEVSYTLTVNKAVEGVGTPTFSLEEGSYYYGTKVEVEAVNATLITYTTDGTEPTLESNTYPEGGIAITHSMTIKAKGFDDDDNESEVSSLTVTLKAPETPTFSVAGGAYVAGTTITITAGEGGDMLAITTNGTDPTAEDITDETTITLTEAMTIKAATVDDGGNLSEIVTNEYTIKVVTELTLDFEEQSNDDWILNNISRDGDGISAHSGDVFASTNGTQTASIRTKQKVALPGTLTAYLSKKSNNTTSSTWYIRVSSDAETWTEVANASASSMNKGTWNEFTADLSSYSDVYVQIYYDGSTAVRAIDDITLTFRKESSVKTPTFSVAAGTYEEVQTVELACETEGATIYYTLDGTTPTNESNEYTEALTISETTTVKAIAYVGEEASGVATAVYTINLPLTTIAEVKELSSGETFSVNLTNAQVVYIDANKKNIYVRDASGAIDIYKNSGYDTELTTGDIFSGTISGTYSPYKNLPEITNADLSGISITGNEAVVAKEITSEEVADNLNDLVKITNTTITEDNGKYYIGEVQLYDNFGVGYTVTTDKSVDVSGIAVVYNTTYEIFPRFESDIVYLESSEAVAIATAGYATFSSTNALDFTGVDAIQAYIAAVDAQGNITFTRVKKVPANTGVLLRNPVAEESVEAVNVPFLTEDADDVEGNCLVAVSEEIASLATEGDGVKNYILNNGSEGVGFYRAAGQKVAAGKAYLQLTTEQNASFIGFTFGEDTPTGIAEVKSLRSNDVVYNLNGQRIKNAAKGLYIVNGKKRLVK